MKVLALLTLVTNAAFASQEGALWLTKFRLESESIEPRQLIVVEGVQEIDSGFRSLVITKAGKKYSVPEEKLKLLRGVRANGVRISEVSGYAVYIQFQLGWSSETYRTVLLTIRENGEIDVGKIEEKKA
jgi:hypothetical protein